MKNLIYLGLIVLLIAFFYPAKPGSTLHRFQGSIKSIGKSEADYRAELRNKQNELAAYEKVIDDITNDFERAVGNAPVCPITGRKAEMTITEDPRNELEEKCEALREEIRILEEKLEALQEVVATNDKQRFAFSQDWKRIRARQGRSIVVDVGLRALPSPAVL